MERNHNNYFGQKGQPFVLVSEFEISPNQLRFAFDGFASTEAFDNGDEPLLNLRRDFILRDDLLSAFEDLHKEVLSQIRQQILAIAGVDSSYDLTFFQIQITKFVIVINAETEDDKLTRVKTAHEYHRIIENNFELVKNALAIAWEFGKTNDAFLASLSK